MRYIIWVSLSISSYTFIAKLSFSPLLQFWKEKVDAIDADLWAILSSVLWPLFLVLFVPTQLLIIAPYTAASKLPEFVSSLRRRWTNRHASQVGQEELLSALGLAEQESKTLARDQVIDALVKDNRVSYEAFVKFTKELRDHR